MYYVHMYIFVFLFFSKAKNESSSKNFSIRDNPVYKFKLDFWKINSRKIHVPRISNL
jgi:hypothetical protein